MKRIIVHWTAGTNKANDLDRQHYHFIIEGDGKIVRGKHQISDNLSVSDGNYAMHTAGCNKDSIGVSLAGMAGAVEQPFNAGKYPITREQWAVLISLVADLCDEYGIKVSRSTVLSHAEVEAELGVKQAGKWDIARLPWNASIVGAHNVGDSLRAAVSAMLAKGGMRSKSLPFITNGETKMGDWFLQRLKAFAAVVVPLLVAAIIKGVEQASGFDIPTEWELSIISVATGLVVHEVPNKPAPAPSQ